MNTIAESQLVSLDARCGTDISEARTADDVMEAAGFDFNMERVPVHTPEGTPLDTHFIIRRTDTNKTFAVMRKRYTVVPIDEMFRPFHNIVEKNGWEYETAGVIDGGKKLWVTAKKPDGFSVGDNPGDKFHSRIAALIANDGSARNAYFGLAHRISCNNQIRVLTKAAAASDYYISHTKNWKDKLMDAEIAFMMAVNAFSQFEKDAEKLTKKQMTSDECRGFATLLFPDKRDDKAKKEKKEPSSKLLNRREKVVDLFTEGVGNRGLNRMDALNAVTEYFNHHNNVSKLDKGGQRAAERRLQSNLFGGNNDIQMRNAMDMLLTEKKFKKAKPVIAE